MNKASFQILSFILITLYLSLPAILSAQGNGGVRGTVLDKETGEPLMFTPVFLNDGIKYNSLSGDDGFYTIASVAPGTYTIQCRAVGYDSIGIEIKIESNKMLNINLSMNPSAMNTGIVEVTSNREESQTDTRVSVVRITAKDIQRLPSAGGESEFAQYLQIIPGVIFTGDQGDDDDREEEDKKVRDDIELPCIEERRPSHAC